MTDQLPNNNQTSPVAPVNPLTQGSPPSLSSSPSAVLPDAPPPQDIAVDPVPLPSASPSNMVNPGTESVVSPDMNVETVVEPDPVKMPEEVVEQPVPEVPETMVVPPAEVQEKPPDTDTPVPEEDPSAIRSPQPSANQPSNSAQQHNKISKKIIAGITGLVFLISGLSVGIYFNSQNFGVLDSRRYAADNMCNVDPSRNCGSDPKEWEKGWIDARKKENEGAIPVQNEYTNANDDQNKNPQDGVQAEIIRRAGETGVGDPGAGNRTGEFVTTSGGAANNPTPTTAVSDSGGPLACPPNQCIREGSGKDGYRCNSTGTGWANPFYCDMGDDGSNPVNGRINTCGCWNGEKAGESGPYLCWAKNPITNELLEQHGQIITKEGCAGGPSPNVVVTTVPNPTATTKPGSPSPTPTTKPGGGGGGGGGGNEPTVPPGSSPTPVTISANCQSLVGQTKDNAGAWVDRTDAVFVGLARPGDQVRFVCTGHKTQGNFTKAAFFINNILHVDDVVKLSADKYAVPYTIPLSGVLTLKVEAVLLHDTEGWK